MAESVDSTESLTAGGSAVVKKHKKVTESPHVLAMRALKAISKTANGELRLSEIPHEVLFGENIDFQSWSLILTDDNLKELSEQRMSQKLFFLDSSADTVKGMFKSFWVPLNCAKGIITLDLTNSKGITDFGLTCIARNNVFLQKLNLTKCTQITDVGLREVGLNCISLLELNISSCHEIDGYGLVSVAECCRQLIKLDVSNCKKLQKYALIKIFYNCPCLEDVNLSGNKDFGDEEIRVLAQNCPDLLALNANECPYVSDQSILTIAQYCPDIDLIDVSRTTMAFRITDVALSALGQKAFSLSTLRMSGCEQITDVGVTWLAEGCKVLRELDISRCNRVTDAGLRFLGNNCHSLTNLNVSFAKQVTDIGVSSLSAGCPKLKHLNCHGAFLLSDPRLTGPTKGAKMESWQTVIGVAALSMNCPEIETLDLSGCFRLNIALHTYVSKLKSLKVLNLMGCNQSSTEALEAIGKGCTELEEVVLTDCGKSVNNASIKSFAMHCKGLHTLTLTRCDNVKGGAIKAIAHFCNNLTKLDLTGCKNLTDSTLLYLCEVDRVPKLKTLSLIDIPQLTDSILAWISIKAHDILLLALKGTLISHKAVMSVRDRFPHSDALTNDNFFGFWPKFRIKDRRLINSYYYVVDGITRIQSKLRVHLAKRRVRNIQHERKVIAAHHLLHRVVRGFLGRCKVHAKKTRMRLEHKSAVVITSIFHRVIALSIVKVKRIAKLMRLKNAMAVKIQLCFRKHRDYNKLVVLKHKRDEFRRLQVRKAIKIQTFARKYFARNKVHRVRVMKYNHNQVINRKATRIQKVYRGMVDRRRCKQLKHYRDTIQARRLEACIKIQRKVRYLKGQWIVKQGQAMKKLRLKSAIMIQSVMRGALARIHVAEIMTERNEIIRNAAALKIQGRLRMLKAMSEFQRRMRVNLNRKANFDNAANIIINQARIKIACLRMKKFRNAKISTLKEKAMVEINAAVKIQSLQRGIMGRAFYMAKLREKKGKWKELFDEKLKKRFFYNKLSGEIRYRMPQDLLDLIPHPNCDNCSHVSAVIECSECNELFCQPCFNKVHDGGRRKLHQWRAIYDYYNKRLDYGDGVFPCKWPTEVMQDEVQGWMLRVAPVRNPVATYPEGWEVYDEATMDNNRVNHSANYNKLHNSFNTQGMSADGTRQFYFNRYTFETSYEMPPAVAQFQRQEAVRTANSAVSGYYDADGTWVERPHTYYGAEAAEAQELEYYRATTAGSTYEQTSQDYDRLEYSNYPVTSYEGGYDESGQLQEYQVNNYMMSNGGTNYFQQQQASQQHVGMSTNTSRPPVSGRLPHDVEVRYANHYGTDNNHIIDENYEYTISDDNSSVPTPHEFSKYSSDVKSFSPQPPQGGSVVLDGGSTTGGGGVDEYKKKPTIVPKKVFKKAET